MKKIIQSTPFTGILLLLLLSPWACTKEATIGLAAPEKQGVISQNDCRISMSYDIVTYTYAQATSPGEQETLSLGEQSLRIPAIESCSVEACVLDNGQVLAEVWMHEPVDAPQYPPGTIGYNTLPSPYAPARMVFNNGDITSYNAEGEPIAQGQAASGSTLFYQGLIDNLGEQATMISSEEMSLTLQGFEAAGFEVRPTGQDRIQLLRHTYADGSYSELILDTELQLIRGQGNFNAAGKLLTKSFFSFSEGMENPILTAHTFKTYMEAPSGTRMVIVRHSKINNFHLEKNL